MKEYELDKELQKKEILMTDEDTGWYYEDHLTAIVKRAEKEGVFDDLKGKGKPLVLDDSDLTYNPDKQLNKILKENNILPNWVKLGKEIEQLKEEVKTYTVEYNIKRTVDKINKKVTAFNLSCPPSVQKRKVTVKEYLQ